MVRYRVSILIPRTAAKEKFIPERHGERVIIYVMMSQNLTVVMGIYIRGIHGRPVRVPVITAQRRTVAPGRLCRDVHVRNRSVIRYQKKAGIFIPGVISVEYLVPVPIHP